MSARLDEVLIDSHCHLDYFTAELDAILARAVAAGVAELVTIGTSLDQSMAIRAVAEARPHVWCTVGVHPQNVGKAPLASPEAIVALTEHPKVVGIGESGLDYFYEGAPAEVQQASFRAHIRAARMAGVPLCIHARSADDDVASVLREEWEQGGPYGFLLHCFSSGRRLAEAALELGGYFSFSGILTFPKSAENRDIARDIPADRLLVETDAPYLAPVPFRGKRNEPAYVAHTAAVLAELRGLSADAMAELTSANFRRLFTRTTPAAA